MRGSKSHDRHMPKISALLPTPMLDEVNRFAARNRMSGGEAFRALLRFSLKHVDDVEWDLNTPPPPVSYPKEPRVHADGVQEHDAELSTLGVKATRGRFTPRRSNSDAE